MVTPSVSTTANTCVFWNRESVAGVVSDCVASLPAAIHDELATSSQEQQLFYALVVYRCVDRVSRYGRRALMRWVSHWIRNDLCDALEAEEGSGSSRRPCLQLLPALFILALLVRGIARVSTQEIDEVNYSLRCVQGSFAVPGPLFAVHIKYLEQAKMVWPPRSRETRSNPVDFEEIVLNIQHEIAVFRANGSVTIKDEEVELSGRDLERLYARALGQQRDVSL